MFLLYYHFQGFPLLGLFTGALRYASCEALALFLCALSFRFSSVFIGIEHLVDAAPWHEDQEMQSRVSADSNLYQPLTLWSQH